MGGYPQNAEEGVGFLGAVVMDGCELSDMGTRNGILVLCQNSKHF